MVTEIIKNEDIAPEYLNINTWIEYGVNYYAKCICERRWEVNNKIYSDWILCVNAVSIRRINKSIKRW